MLAIILAAVVATTYAQTSNLTSSDMPAPTEAPSNLTAQLFIDGTPNAQTGYVASLVSDNPCGTTYVLECSQTSRPNVLCQLNTNVALTITARPTDYEMLYEREFPVGGSGTVTQSCKFDGPSPSFTQAICSLSAWASLGARRIEITSTVETVAGSDIPMTAVVPITAGESNTGSTCAPSTSSTTPFTRSTNMVPSATPSTQEMEDAAPTGLASEVYKVLIPIGAAAVGLALA